MLLAHRVRIEATTAQRHYFARAAGTARRVWNWALAEWERQYAAGGKPNAMALKREFNAIKYTDPAWLDADGLPWLKTMHRDSHAQPFANLERAFGRYIGDLRSGSPVHRPRFKRKERCPDSFYVANDKFRLEGCSAVLPKIGRVVLSETLVIEDLNVKGMLSNGRLARAISDVGFGRIRRQLVYKAQRHGTQLVVADRWYPSSKLCSTCGWKYDGLTLSERRVHPVRRRPRPGSQCGNHKQRLATGAATMSAAEFALPVARRTVRSGAASGKRPHVDGKVTPVRDEHNTQDRSGQEVKSDHVYSLFR
jgi:IS605 OrfB family transposase